MGYKRATWHSGLTYQQTCYHCRAVVRYTDYDLGFRAWYPDGFVYCPRCKGNLRHNELYAIHPDGTPVYPQPVQQQPVPQQPMPQQPMQQPMPQQPPAENTAYCTNCGSPYAHGVDRFCSTCGQKLED